MKRVYMGFLEKVRQGKSTHIIFFVVSMGILFVTYCFLHPILYRNMIQNSKIFEDDFNWMFQAEYSQHSDKELIIEGWAFKQRTVSEFQKYEIVLYDATTKTYCFANMEYQIREDVDKYFACEFDYSKSGFRASFSTRKLDLSGKCYELLLLQKDQTKLYHSGIYYYNNELTAINPETDYTFSNVEGTDLEPIILDGHALVSRPDVGIFIYQYQNDLYYITNERFEFQAGNIHIPLHINTNQVNRLPQDKVNQGITWANLDFYFKDKELIDWNTGEYRVARCSLPTDFSIIQISTGRYDGDWLWKAAFRPFYYFE